MGTTQLKRERKTIAYDIIKEVNCRIDCIEEINKFNPYHDARGRFTSANSAASFTYSPGKSKAHDKAIAREKVRNNPYIHRSVKDLDDLYEKTITEFRQAQQKASLKPSKATNRVIASNKKKMERLGGDLKRIQQARDYVSEYGNGNVPF